MNINKALRNLNQNNLKITKNRNIKLFVAAFWVSTILVPTAGYGSIEGTLSSIQEKLIMTTLPLLAGLGVVFAGLSFAVGYRHSRGDIRSGSYALKAGGKK